MPDLATLARGHPAAIAAAVVLILLLVVYFRGAFGLGPYSGAAPAAPSAADPETEDLIGKINRA